ncbi:MAG: PP2C family serine/threonine-protein phosphatase [Muribaculaceae bacterium]|nr:PP2C family serine/threonine-protein phosphatase [Muribaculaceae bacterium]
MDRKKRIARQKTQSSIRLNETARAIDRAMIKAGIPASDKETFLNWALVQLWKTFKEERMNKRLIIENEVKNLNIRFPNGTVKKDYSVHFTLPLDKISNPRIEGTDELGLVFDFTGQGECSLSGKPQLAGDFTLTLKYDTVEGEEPSELKIPVAFNPDPRSLWRVIPTDENIPYYKNDIDTAYVKVEAGADGQPKKDIVAASKRGRSHAQEGKARDDHFTLFHCNDSDWYIIAVADGAGSAKYSRKGSEIACDTVVNHCKNLLAGNPMFESAIREYESDRDDAAKRTTLTKHVIDIVYNGALKAHEAVKKAAEANQESKLKDFATTLMFVICKKYDFGWFIASFWVGDGAMCLFDEKQKTAKLLGTPDEGEFSGQTRFLTMPEIFRDKDVVAKRLRMAIVPDFTALFLMSDGVSDPMFETDNNLNDYSKWEEFWNTLKNGFPEDEIGGVDLSDDNEKAKDQLLGWLDFWSPGNHDDRTIAILY